MEAMAGHSHDMQPHGAFLGHMVPGIMFIIWGSWWLFASAREHILSNAQSPYRSKAWFELPALPGVPLEPLAKIFGCLIGIFGELLIGTDWSPSMFTEHGGFKPANINNWQHAAMYFAYLTAGVVDIAAFYTNLPADCEQGALAAAFIVEGLLLGFHLKGSPLEILVHKILVITIAASALVMLAEIRYKGNVLLTVARAMLVGLQGIWFIQIGYIMFRKLPEWDPRDMGSVMMVPALYCLDIMLLILGCLAFYVGLRVVLNRLHRGVFSHQPLQQQDDGWPLDDSLKLNGNDRRGILADTRSVQLSAF